jgi:hypothetical protein
MTPNTEQSYSENWQAYRRTRTVFLLVILSYLPISAIAAQIGFWLFRSTLLGFVVALIWMGAFAITGLRLQSWPCPRCGEAFSAKGWYNKSFLARRCVHCGLPKFAASGSECN